jgi:hypothetical protein
LICANAAAAVAVCQREEAAVRMWGWGLAYVLTVNMQIFQ